MAKATENKTSTEAGADSQTAAVIPPSDKAVGSKTHLPKRLLLVAGGVIVISLTWLGLRLIVDNEPQQEPAVEPDSFASALENAELDPSIDSAGKAVHYMTIAYAYQADGEHQKAADFFLKSYEENIVGEAIFLELIKSYEALDDNENRNRFLNELINYYNQEIAGLEDGINKASRLYSLGEAYEKLGDTDNAKQTFQTALELAKIIDHTSTEDGNLIQSLNQKLGQ